MRRNDHIIILFYTFCKIRNPEKVRDDQKALCSRLHLKGRVLIAHEGVNATLEGRKRDIETYIGAMRETRLFRDVTFKKSVGSGNGFSKLSVKVRPEIVTLSAGSFDVRKETAKEITASKLEQMYAKGEEFTVLDLRNDYEIQVGKFDKTEHLKLDHFRELPKKLSRVSHLKKKKVVAVCTGGIRCEKATCLLKRKGFEHVLQLKNGIHAYMQKYPGKHFKGSLFVFDNRMTTPIVDIPKRKVVGVCAYCGVSCEDFYNDDSTRPSRKVICCTRCIRTRARQLRPCVSA